MTWKILETFTVLAVYKILQLMVWSDVVDITNRTSCKVLKPWRVGCCRAIVAAKKCLLFEPASASSRKFLEVAAPRLQASEARSTPPALSCLLLEALAKRCCQGL